MDLFIDGIVGQILSVVFSEGASKWIEWTDCEKRKRTLRENLCSILESEKENHYYNDLVKVLSNSHILCDCFSSYESGIPVPHIEQRITDILSQNHIESANSICIIGVLRRMLQCVDSVMSAPSSAEEARLMRQIKVQHENYLAVLEHLKYIEAELERNRAILNGHSASKLTITEIISYGEPIHSMTGLIPRKLVPFNENDDTIHSIELMLILQKARVAIVNDAGLGKTQALRQLHAEATANGYNCVYLSLNRFPGIPLLTKLENEDSIDTKVTLILDGYDEVKSEYLDQLTASLNSIASKHRSVTIVVSSRSNFYLHHSLANFNSYRLADITQEDREQYLINHGIDVSQFNRQVYEKGLSSMTESIFNFVELVHLWQADGKLPDEATAMERMVERRLQADRHKYEVASPELDENTASIRSILERIAFIMQCTHNMSITREQLLQVCESDYCEQIKLHGIWEEDIEGNLRFAHNNFREYFVACKLNRLSINEIVSYIAWPGDNTSVKSSWMNVLAYLAKMRTERDLSDWIAQNDPCVITLFEKRLFSDSERLKIFTRIYEIHERNQTWADIWGASGKRMGDFAACSGAVAYILDKLTTNIHWRQEKNLLRVLARLDNVYEHVDDCHFVISSIAFDETNPSNVRDDAIDVMRAFPHIFEDCINKAAERCMLSEDETHRYHLYSFIYEAGKIDEHFDVIIHELRQPRNKEGIIDVSGSMFLNKVFSSIQSPDSLIKLLEFAAENPEYISKDPYKKTWKHLMQSASRYHDTHGKEILSLVLRIFSQAQCQINPSIVNEIKSYMVTTRSDEAFLKFILDNEDVRTIFDLTSLLCPSFAVVLISYYEDDKLPDDNMLELIYKKATCDDDTCAKLLRAIHKKTHKVPNKPNRFSYEESERMGHQRFVDSLSSRQIFSDLVDELCSIVGKDTLVKDTYYVFCEAVEQSVALRDCLYTLHHIAPDDSNVTFGEAITCISDWDWFRYKKTSRMIEQHKDIVLNAEQSAWMEQYTRELLATFDIEDVVKTFALSKSIARKLYIGFKTMCMLNLSFPEDYLCSLLRLPNFCFGDSDYLSFPKYLLENIPACRIQEHVLFNIEHADLCEEVVAMHLRYCTENNLKGAKDFAIRYLKCGDENCYRYSALNYLSTVYGMDVIINEVVPLCSEPNFLNDIAHHIPFDVPVPLLDEKLVATYKNAPASKWQEILIKRNNRLALQQYLKDAEVCHGIPDMTKGSLVPSLTDSISIVTDHRLVDLIISLLRLCDKPGFKDKNSFGLRHSCWEAIKRMASTQYEKIREALVAERDSSEDDHKLTCIDLIQTIDDLYHVRIDEPMTFEVALMLTAK